MNQYDDLLVDALLDRGFSVDEAVRLIHLQNRLDREQRERDEQLRFSRWINRLFGSAEQA